jgi:NADH:ubiquinone reductase (H+-translocating)
LWPAPGSAAWPPPGRWPAPGCIFAVGDIALIDGEPLPQLAQPALQMGRHAAGQIRRLERGQPVVPFRYRDKGIMATIGYRSAAVQLPGRLRSRGTPAWLAWLALHLISLLGGRNRISALVNLSWRYLSCRHGGGLIVGEGTTGPAPPSGPPTPRGGRAGPRGGGPSL